MRITNNEQGMMNDEVFHVKRFTSTFFRSMFFVRNYLTLLIAQHIQTLFLGDHRTRLLS